MNLRLATQYHLRCLVRTPFEFVFWVIEQLKGRITDGLANWMTEP